MIAASRWETTIAMPATALTKCGEPALAEHERGRLEPSQLRRITDPQRTFHVANHVVEALLSRLGLFTAAAFRVYAIPIAAAIGCMSDCTNTRSHHLDGKRAHAKHACGRAQAHARSAVKRGAPPRALLAARCDALISTLAVFPELDLVLTAEVVGIRR
jgi:hypothetical protein